tara:strand:- start:1776 stop:2387 length:612 start_codon:yes stop_codon:yes gene_type:complete
MSIKQNGGVFGRNPTFNDVTIEGQLTFDGDIDINSDLKVDGNIETTGNVIIATSGKGIDFSATSGTGTSELLDDYEEGTWTPTLIGTTSGSAVITVTEAVYTKIGRQVFVSARVTANLSSHSVSGSCEIGGLPYSTSPTDMGGGNSSFCSMFTTDLTTTSIHFRPIGTRLRVVKGSSSTSFSSGDLATGANALMMFHATYQVA